MTFLIYLVILSLLASPLLLKVEGDDAQIAEIARLLGGYLTSPVAGQELLDEFFESAQIKKKKKL
jgi:hypothetical protein